MSFAIHNDFLSLSSKEKKNCLKIFKIQPQIYFERLGLQKSRNRHFCIVYHSINNNNNKSMKRNTFSSSCKRDLNFSI